MLDRPTPEETGLLGRHVPTEDMLGRLSLSSVERVVTQREEGDVVVRRKPRIGRTGAGGDARECCQSHIFVLNAGSDPPHIALVKVLPESDRELLRLLHVERAGETCNGRVEGTQGATGQILIDAPVVDEVRISPAALRAGNGPRLA